MADYSLTDISVLENSDDDQLNLLKDFSFCLEENRLKTFKNWIYKEPAKCTAEAMAQAGFIHVASADTPDSARCFFCCKELDGWEPDDDPWEEHISHSRKKCQFLNYAKEFETGITIKKFIELEIQRQTSIAKMGCEQMKQRVKDQAQLVRKKMIDMV